VPPGPSAALNFFSWVQSEKKEGRLGSSKPVNSATARVDQPDDMNLTSETGYPVSLCPNGIGDLDWSEKNRIKTNLVILAVVDANQPQAPIRNRQFNAASGAPGASRNAPTFAGRGGALIAEKTKLRKSDPSKIPPSDKINSKISFGSVSDRLGHRVHQCKCTAWTELQLEGLTMWNVRAAIMGLLLITWASPAFAEVNAIELSLNDASQVDPRNVTVKAIRYRGSDVLEVRLAGPYRGPDMDTFALVPGLDFHDGTIEVDVAGSVLPTALSGARGFIGVAFRIDAAAGSFSSEGFYIRPANGRAEDQVRRNHSTQYFSYPGYDFDRLRREAPGQYEAYTDLVPGEWTHLRIEVSGATAQFYVGAAPQPVLIVHDLKRGSDAHGTVGLWVDNGTDGHFRNLSIRPR